MLDNNELDYPYLKKSIKTFKISAGLFLLSFVGILFIQPLFIDSNETISFAVTVLFSLALLAIVFLAPLGIFYSWKSYKSQEGFASKRLLFFLGHLFFCLITLGVFFVLLNDLSQLTA